MQAGAPGCLQDALLNPQGLFLFSCSRTTEERLNHRTQRGALYMLDRMNSEDPDLRRNNTGEVASPKSNLLDSNPQSWKDLDLGASFARS